MTNVVYKNLTKAEAEQMAFETEVEGKFKFEIKKEGSSWSFHYWSPEQHPAVVEGPLASNSSASMTSLAEAVAPVAHANLMAAAGAPEEGLLFHPPANWRLGNLSTKYETGGRGPGTVSSGIGDPGGVSYGSYQMTSRGGGTVLLFVSHESFPWRDRFEGLEPGSEAFSEVWRVLANEDSDAFFEAQHTYIERTHFAPMLRRTRTIFNIDLISRSHALLDAVWSTAVQHGPNSSIVKMTIEKLGGANALKPGDIEGDRRLIRAIYAERGRRGADGKLVHFHSVESAQVQQALTDRFIKEERDALAMLDA